jgi:hypothetical protein
MVDLIIVYPLVCTIWSLRRPLKAELQHWLVWWITYEVMTYIVTLFWWIPLSNFIKCTTLFLLYIPITTEHVRKKWICISYKTIKKKFDSDLFRYAKMYVVKVLQTMGYTFYDKLVRQKS